jgi:hypothetical protein
MCMSGPRVATWLMQGQFVLLGRRTPLLPQSRVLSGPPLTNALLLLLQRLQVNLTGLPQPGTTSTTCLHCCTAMAAGRLARLPASGRRKRRGQRGEEGSGQVGVRRRPFAAPDRPAACATKATAQGKSSACWLTACAWQPQHRVRSNRKQASSLRTWPTRPDRCVC